MGLTIDIMKYLNAEENHCNSIEQNNNKILGSFMGNKGMTKWIVIDSIWHYLGQEGRERRRGRGRSNGWNEEEKKEGEDG